MKNKRLIIGSMIWLGWTLAGCGGGPLPDQPQTGGETANTGNTADTSTAGNATDPSTEVEDDAEPEQDNPAVADATPEAGEPATDAVEGSTTGQAATGTPAALQLDANGVAMVFPSNTAGSSWSLGTRNPNTVDQTYFDLNGDKATQGSDQGVSYWSTSGHKVSYASGAPDGVTVRLNIKASGGTQKYTWNNGALTNGYLGNPRDVKNMEATVYVRVSNPKGTHTSMAWKMHGGKHSSSNGALASCIEMDVPYGGLPPRAARELNHPNYEYVKLAPKFPYQLQPGKWVGVKAVSYLVPGGTRNQLYLDTDPFDASGKPRNNFKLFSEWMDKNGQSTGHYTQAATWGGWVTTFRVDGWNKVDFTYPSVREIIPPAS